MRGCGPGKPVKGKSRPRHARGFRLEPENICSLRALPALTRSRAHQEAFGLTESSVNPPNRRLMASELTPKPRTALTHPTLTTAFDAESSFMVSFHIPVW